MTNSYSWENLLKKIALEFNPNEEYYLDIKAKYMKGQQSVVREIYSGGNIKVSITEDLDNLKNSDKVLVVGSKNTIKYEFQTISEMMVN